MTLHNRCDGEVFQRYSCDRCGEPHSPINFRADGEFMDYTYLCSPCIWALHEAQTTPNQGREKNDDV